MSANPAGDALGMAVDDATITADGSDATRAVFRAIDAYGNQRRYGSGNVTLTLSARPRWWATTRSRSAIRRARRGVDPLAGRRSRGPSR